MPPIYKVSPLADWRQARAAGCFEGSAHDRRDGFIHFSTAEQLPGTLARHYAGQHDLVLAAIDPDRLGAALRWEPARDGSLFPHLYGPLDMSAVVRELPLEIDDAGQHRLPEDL